MLILERVALIPKLSVRSLGLLLDADLLLDGEVAAVASGSYHQLRQVHQLHPFFDKRDLMMVTHALVPSRLDYCHVDYVGMPLNVPQKMQLVQNATATNIQ